MNKLTIYGENNPSGMGPSCSGLFLDGFNYNLMFDCGYAINNKDTEDHMDALGNVCEKTLNYNISENLRTSLKQILFEIKKDEDVKNELQQEGNLVGPRLDLVHEKIDLFIASHAHLDHIGAMLNIKDKFKKNAKIIGSPYTLRLSSYQLYDLMGNKSNKGFNLGNIFETQNRFKEIQLGEQEILPGLKAFVVHSGHIHGSISIIIKLKNGKNAMFLTDTKFENQILLKGAKFLSEVIPKSWAPNIFLSTDLTYRFKGQKNYEKECERLVNKVIKTTNRGGKVLIPSFMFIRGQSAPVLLASELKKRNIPLYVDGGIRGVFPLIENNYWSDYEIDFSTDWIQFVQNYNRKEKRDHRQELMDNNGPLVIISTSGMGDFGPVGGKYLSWFLKEKKNAVIFIGHQSPGTIGYELTHAGMNGSRKKILWHGKEIDIKSDVEKIDITGHSGSDKFCYFFEDNIENLLDGQKMELCVLTHGDYENKEEAAKLFNPYFKNIEIAETGKIVEF